MDKLSLTSILFRLLQKDLLIAYRKTSSYLTPLIFFLVVLTFFPLAIGSDSSFLNRIAPGTLWIAALLSSLLAVESLFNEDFNDGTLDQLFISNQPIFLLIIVKVFSHWMITGSPILLASMIGVIFFDLPTSSIFTLLVSLILGTLILSFLSAFGGALSLGKGAILSAIIVLPFSIPVLLLGTAATNAAIQEIEHSSYLFFLGAMLFIVMPFISIATAEALRINSD